MDNKKIYQVDAFCDQPFKGNPAGVMILETAMASGRMQNIAMEMNLAETAFVVQESDHFSIRYFTPTTEVPLCGHATLASAHILYELGLVPQNEKINFKAEGGDLTINKEADWIQMIFPKYPLTVVEIPERFQDNVGFSPIAMYSSRDHWKIAVATSEEQIRQAQPKFSEMEAHGIGHLMITSKSVSDDYDFVVRCFAPMSGIDEDPVTGSAHCALIPLWAERLHKTEMTSLQCSKRTGVLEVALAENQVIIKGQAITVFEADLRV